ncbi:integrase, catalytic region, zinc finger, CCHC-type containing protein [Tanacetum coccineum]
MSTVNQQTLVESGASDRPLILEKGSYTPWASAYKRKGIPDSDNESKTISKPISKISKPEKEQYFANFRVMNYILQGIPNDIYNSVDACPNAKQIYKFPCSFFKFYDVSTFSCSITTNYVTSFQSVIDNDDDYQGKIQGEAQKDKLTTAMILLARAITQCYSTPTNNRLRSSSNTRNQAVVQDGRVDIQSKNVGYAGNGNKNNIQRNLRTELTLRKTNVQCYNCNEKGHYARECPKPRFRDAKYSREQMLLATKDEARELNATVIMMARIQPTDDKSDAKPTFDAEFISEAKHIDNLVGNEAVHKELGDRMERAATTASSLEAEQDNVSLGAQEDASKQGRSIEDLDANVEVPLVDKSQRRQDEDLMFDTGVIDSDEMFVDATTGKKEEQSTKVDAMEVSTAEPVTTAGEVVTTASEAFSTAGVEDSVAPTIPVTTVATTPQNSKDELTLAQTLMEIKAAKPKVVTTAATTVSTKSKAKGVFIQELSETTTRAVITALKLQAKDKGKSIMVEPELPLKKKDQIALDAELTFKLHAEEQAELEKIQKERDAQEEANIAITEKWNEVQAKMEADMELAQRLQSKEQEQYTDEEKAKMFMELLQKKWKFFARKR